MFLDLNEIVDYVLKEIAQGIPQTKKPTAVFVTGLIGAGKTTFANEYAQAHDVVLIDVDHRILELVRSIKGAHFQDTDYMRQLGKVLMRKALQAGYSVCNAFPGNKPDYLDDFRFCKDWEIPFEIQHIAAPSELQNSHIANSDRTSKGITNVQVQNNRGLYPSGLNRQIRTCKNGFATMTCRWNVDDQKPLEVIWRFSNGQLEIKNEQATACYLRESFPQLKNDDDGTVIEFFKGYVADAAVLEDFYLTELPHEVIEGMRRIIGKWMKQENGEKRDKSDGRVGTPDWQTSADTDMEKWLQELLRRRLGEDIGFVGEEAGYSPAGLQQMLTQHKTTVIADPIDGTKLVVAGHDGFATQLTWFEDGQPAGALIAIARFSEKDAYSPENWEFDVIVSTRAAGVYAMHLDQKQEITIKRINPPLDKSGEGTISVQTSKFEETIKEVLRDTRGVLTDRTGLEFEEVSSRMALTENQRGTAALDFYNLLHYPNAFAWATSGDKAHDFSPSIAIFGFLGYEVLTLDGIPYDVAMAKGYSLKGAIVALPQHVEGIMEFFRSCMQSAVSAPSANLNIPPPRCIHT